MRVIFRSLLAFVVVAFIVDAAHSHELPSTLENAQRAWKARQDRTRSARFTIETARLFPANSEIHPARLFHRRIGKKLKGPLPELNYNVAKTLTFDGSKVREYIDGPYMVDGAPQIDHRSRSLEAFDGNETRKLMTYTADGRYPQGYILRDPVSPTNGEIVYAPIFWTFRALIPALAGFKSVGLIDTQETGVIDGHRCLIFAQQGRVGEWLYWVDPNRDFSINRLTWRHNSLPRLLVDVKYKVDDANGLVPTDWTIQRFGRNGTSGQFIRAKVTSYELNEPYSAETFRVEFPIGTWVYDGRNDTEYIVRPNNEARHIQRAELTGMATYKQLISSQPGEALVEPMSIGRIVLLTLNGLLIVVIALRLAVKFRHTAA